MFCLKFMFLQRFFFYIFVAARQLEAGVME